jgi:hypothetical protein
MRLEDSGTVDANVIGSGDITLSGNVKDYKYNVRGSGDMNISGLTVGK